MALKLPQQSIACQTWDITCVQVPPVLEPLKGMTVTFVPQQRENAFGGLLVNGVPHWIVLLLAQVSVGGAVTIKVTAWVQNPIEPRQSVTVQIRVTTGGQTVPLVPVMEVMVKFVPQQASKTVGGSKLHGASHITVLFVAQNRDGGGQPLVRVVISK